ncbi:MAG: hypothetical protein LBO02_03060 [Holosporaceae bacterium]|jgi:hypothetical protein|nr:hypothetical protein [Holosporaceae bacterium]
MSIISIISGFIITKTVSAGKIMRAQITKSNIETTAVALAAFLANQNRLPRPSFDDDGRESLESGTNLFNFVGKVPYHSLGISAKIALDGNGKPLIYMVEPKLAGNFQSIYERGMDNYFCSGIFSPSIVINNIEDPSPDVIAFAIDVHDNPPVITEKINVRISSNTSWFSRDRLLMQYLKNRPCKSEIKPTTENSNGAEQFNF